MKRFFATLLAALMLVSMIPVSVAAAGSASGTVNFKVYYDDGNDAWTDIPLAGVAMAFGYSRNMTEFTTGLTDINGEVSMAATADTGNGDYALHSNPATTGFAWSTPETRQVRTVGTLTNAQVHGTSNPVAYATGNNFVMNFNCRVGVTSGSTYLLQLDHNDGSNTVDSVRVVVGATPALPTLANRTGYTFAGWMKADDNLIEGANVPNDLGAANATVTLKAKWTVNPHTITFNTDGGTEIPVANYNYSDTIVAPTAPTKTGYTFAGWSPALPPTMPDEDLTVTAQWTVNQYTITFDTDGGTEIASITQDYNTAVTKPANPTKPDHKFDGWDKPIPATMPAENVTITAKWKLIAHVCADGNSDGFCDEAECGLCLHTQAANGFCATENCTHDDSCACHPDPTDGVREITVTAKDTNGVGVAGVSVQLYVNKNQGNGMADHVAISDIVPTNADGVATFGNDVLDDVAEGWTVYSSVSGDFEWANKDIVRVAAAGIHTSVVKDTDGNGYLWVVAPAGIGFNGGFSCEVMPNDNEDAVGKVHFVIKDESGAPLSGIKMNLVATNNEVRTPIAQFVTDDEGKYTVILDDFAQITTDTILDCDPVDDNFLWSETLVAQGAVRQVIDATNVVLTTNINHSVKPTSAGLRSGFEFTFVCTVSNAGKSYTVKFDANGGDGEMEDQVILLDQEVALSVNTFTHPHAVFIGWKDAAGNEYDDGAAMLNAAADGETLVLTAQWEANVYTITWANHDGTPIKQVGIRAGSTPIYTGDTPVKVTDDGKEWKFIGWDPQPSPAVENATYTAQFEEVEPEVEEPTRNNWFTFIVTGVTQVKVVDAETEAALQGATFELYRISATGSRKLQGTYTSNATGRITARTLSPRFTYELVMTAAPEGYDLLEVPVVFRVQYNRPLQQVVVLTKTVVEEAPVEEVPAE